MESTQIYKAWLWDGIRQMEGKLILSKENLIFKPRIFENGNLKIEIQLISISNMETFLLFGISKNGLKIFTEDEKYDSFILEDISDFKKVLLQKMKHLDKKFNDV